MITLSVPLIHHPTSEKVSNGIGTAIREFLSLKQPRTGRNDICEYPRHTPAPLLYTPVRLYLDPDLFGWGERARPRIGAANFKSLRTPRLSGALTVGRSTLNSRSASLLSSESSASRLRRSPSPFRRHKVAFQMHVQTHPPVLRTDNL